MKGILPKTIYSLLESVSFLLRVGIPDSCNERPPQDKRKLLQLRMIPNKVIISARHTLTNGDGRTDIGQHIEFSLLKK